MRNIKNTYENYSPKVIEKLGYYVKLICLDRYHPNTTEITKYGSFFRMGYEPEDLYDELKIKIKSLFMRR